MEKMSMVLREYMDKNKVLISYVRDTYGFKKGVVVSTGKGKIGWSLVNGSKDIIFKFLRPDQLPTIQWMMNNGADVKFISQTPAYKRCLLNGGTVRVPIFDRNVGILNALDRALNGSVQITDGGVIVDSALPRDKDLARTLSAALDRSNKFFSPKTV